MNGYPADSLDHNVPFLVASGLDSAEPPADLPAELESQGQLVESDQPPLDTRESQVVERYLADVDARGTSWALSARDQPYRLRVQTIGRSYPLPPRKATLPDSVDPAETGAILHSPFSPLSHVSALYPDGLIDRQWIRKHQALVPSIFVSFYKLGNDNQLKHDINRIKTTLARSGYKTRLAVVFFGDEDMGTAVLTEEIQDRLEAIRKGTALDPKSIFYIPGRQSPGDLKRSLDNILAILYAIAVEYYRDLGRHARKKRSRGVAPRPTIPPTSGTSHTLSLSDWTFRYDFKTAVLAEFRQELDAAIRSFEQAYEILLGQDVLDAVPSWSPRWNEARQLADIISIRCLRLHLWMGHTSLAVRRWQAHRDRIGDFVDRRGHGTNTYGWQAWEARWAEVMANLIERVAVPGLVPASPLIFLPPEKAVLGERLHPWEHLHHTGYWYRIAARHLAARRTLARMMPDEDRRVPESPSGNRATASNYDTYMCPPPYEEYPLSGNGGGVNHAQQIIDVLVKSRTQFEARKQLRIAAELSLECAREMAFLGSWEEALANLRSVWYGNSFRSDNWLDISEDLCWLLRRAAKECNKADLVVAVDWELMNGRFSKRQHWHYDLSQSLDGMTVSGKQPVQISDETASPLISSDFAFQTRESKAGDHCKAQLTLRSNAVHGAKPLILSSVRIEFEGSLKPIVLEHEPADDSQGDVEAPLVTEVDLAEKTGDEDDALTELRGACNLVLKAGQRRVLEVMIPIREPGEAKALSAVLEFRTGAFDLRYTTSFNETDSERLWYAKRAGKPRRLRADARTLRIEPKPPKLQITLLNLAAQYYTDEVIELRVELRNDEEDTAVVKFDAQLLGDLRPAIKIRAGEEASLGDEGELLNKNLGAIARGGVMEMRLAIDPIAASTTHELHLRAVYHLHSDPATPIVQALPIQVVVVSPFEANYDLLPRLHPDPWPSLFDWAESTDEGKARDGIGLAQRWSLLCHYASFASEDVVVTGMEMQVLSCTGGAQCTVSRQPGDELMGNGIMVSPRSMSEAQFDLLVQKFSLDDRHNVALDLAFAIKWKRAEPEAGAGAGAGVGAGGASADNVTTLPVGQYLVLGMEPRVLAMAMHSEGSPRLLRLDLMIENPSDHFLTFGLSMDPSDQFGFSGAKQTTVHLLPMSRRRLRYRLLPYVRGDYIRPGLVVRDKYFQKVLRIIPTEGMKIDKNGLLVWVPGGKAVTGTKP